MFQNWSSKFYRTDDHNELTLFRPKVGKSKRPRKMLNSRKHCIGCAPQWLLYQTLCLLPSSILDTNRLFVPLTFSFAVKYKKIKVEFYIQNKSRQPLLIADEVVSRAHSIPRIRVQGPILKRFLHLRTNLQTFPKA